MLIPPDDGLTLGLRVRRRASAYLETFPDPALPPTGTDPDGPDFCIDWDQGMRSSPDSRLLAGLEVGMRLGMPIAALELRNFAAALMAQHAS